MNPLSSHPYSTIIPLWSLIPRKSDPSFFTLPRFFSSAGPTIRTFRTYTLASLSNTAPILSYKRAGFHILGGGGLFLETDDTKIPTPLDTRVGRMDQSI